MICAYLTLLFYTVKYSDKALINLPLKYGIVFNNEQIYVMLNINRIEKLNLQN